MSFEGKRKKLVALVCSVTALAAVACGDDADSPTTPSKRKVLVPNEEPSTFISRMTKSLETAENKKDCKEIYEINGRSVVPFPCPAPASMRKSLAKFRVVGAEIHGSAGVVDYASGKAPKGAAIVLYAAPNRHWGVGHFGLKARPSVGTSDSRTRAAYRDAVTRYLQAIRNRDCDEWVKVAATETDDKETNCGRPFDATKQLAKRLKQNPGAKLKYEGGNGTFGFLSIETAKPVPENSTIGVLRLVQAGRPVYAVLDVVPAPTAATMAELRQDIQIQENLAKSRTEPSKQPLER